DRHRVEMADERTETRVFLLGEPRHEVAHGARGVERRDDLPQLARLEGTARVDRPLEHAARVVDVGERDALALADELDHLVGLLEAELRLVAAPERLHAPEHLPPESGRAVTRDHVAHALEL